MDALTAFALYASIGAWIGIFDVMFGIFEPTLKNNYKAVREIQSEKDTLIKGILFTLFVTLPSLSFWVSSGPILSEDLAKSTWGQPLFIVMTIGAWARLIYKLYLWKKLNDRYKELLLQEAIAKGVEIGNEES
jgi:O-antigen/teichoic acid export membrane protein